MTKSNRSSIHGNLARKELSTGGSDRAFGVVFFIFFMVIALWPLTNQDDPRLWAILTAALFLTVALLLPTVLGPLNKVWTLFGLLLHKITNPIITGIMYFLVISPIGLLMRLLGKKPLAMKFDAEADSYWIDVSEQQRQGDEFNNQF